MRNNSLLAVFAKGKLRNSKLGHYRHPPLSNEGLAAPPPLKLFSRVVQVRPAMKKEPCGQWETQNNGATLTTCRDKNGIKLTKFQLFSLVNQGVSDRKREDRLICVIDF